MMNEMGWGDDDDLELDDSDSDVESTGAGTGAGVQLGQGLLMGRLTRFLDNVTSPDDNGWEEDDGLDDLSDDGWQEDDDVLDEALDEQQPQEQQPPSAAGGSEEESFQMEPSGWEDDGLGDLVDEGDSEAWPDGQLEGLDDDDAKAKNDTDAVAAACQVPELKEEEEVGSAWSDAILDDLELDENGAASQTEAANDVAPEKGTEEEAGWADDDLGDLDELESGEQAVESTERVTEAPNVTEQADSGWNNDGLEDLDGNDMEKEPKDAAVSPAGPANGWDDTELDGLEDDDHAHVATSDGNQQVTEELPPVSETDEVGWADDDDLEGLDDDVGDMPGTPQRRPADSAVMVDHVPSTPRAVKRHESMLTAAGDESTVRRENARDEDDDEQSDDYGPVVDRFPSVHALEHAARTVSTVAPSSVAVSEDFDNERIALPLLSSQHTNDVVDHVPESTPDTSNKDYAESTVTIAGDESAVLRENARDDEAAEGDYGPVVDRMPSNRETGHTCRTVSTIAPSSWSAEEEDNGGTSDVAGENDTQEGGASDVAVACQPSNALVDHVPEDLSKATSYRDSIAAIASERSVASELSNTIGEEPLESDVDAREENYGPVVDHTPLPQPRPSVLLRSTSVRVQAPIEEIDEDDDDIDDFGPVVDHTPTVHQSTASSIAGSMAVMAPPSELADDSDNELDEQTDVNGDQEEDASDFVTRDDDTLDAPTASLISGPKEEHLVDHVPRRREPRPTDASTLVLVDPSEVSTVGDMTYEEQQYGPVVDHTPTAQEPSMQQQPSVAGSTVDAAAASVGQDDTMVDDMDDAVDGASHRDENELSEGDDDATLPTLDIQPPMEANVVDHVPETDPVYRIDSELTIGPTQSILSPDETRDEDFGLVVDHLPVGPPSPPSRGSMAVLAPASVVERNGDEESTTVNEEVNEARDQEEQPASEQPTEGSKVVVDHLPPVRDTSTHPSGSTLTVRSQVSEDATLGDFVSDRFGPVVDQLPSGVSLRGSLGGGGSTTGALATLSEVNDDTVLDEDGQGWDYDDQELDSTLDGTERETGENGTARDRPAGKGLSVTFSSRFQSVRILDEVTGDNVNSLEPEDNRYYDTELVDSNEGEYFDPEAGDLHVMDEQVMQPSVDSGPAESSPSKAERGTTNRRERLNEGHLVRSILDNDPSLHMNGGSRATELSGAVMTCPCAEAQTAKCPCIQSILDTNDDEDAMVGSLVTPEGAPVRIDFKKLLQHETTKRLLLEKELEACNSVIESLESTLSNLEAKSTADKATIDGLRDTTQTVSNERDSLRGDCDVLRMEKEELSAQLSVSRGERSELARERDEFAARESELRAEIEELRSSCEASSLEAREAESRSSQLASDLEQALSSQLVQQRRQCNELEAKNSQLLEVQTLQEKEISDMNLERSDWSSQKSAFEDEILRLRRTLEESSSAATSESIVREQLSALQIESAAKSGECEKLKSQLDETQKRLQESEGRNFAQMKEAMRMKRLHDGELAKYQEQILSLEKSNENALATHEASAKSLSDRVQVLEAELQALKSENESLQDSLKDSQTEHANQVKQQKVLLQEKLGQIRVLDSKVTALEMDLARSNTELSAKNAMLEDRTARVDAASSLEQEYGSLQETLSVNKETIQSLQDQVEALSQANKQGADQMETLVDSIKQERDSLQNELLCRDEKINALTSDLEASTGELISQKEQIQLLTTKCEELEACVEGLQSDAVKYEAELSEKDRIIDSLQGSQMTAQTAASTEAQHQYESELQDLRQSLSEREEQVRGLHVQLDAYQKTIHERNSSVSELERRCTEVQESNNAIAQERDELFVRCREMENELVDAKKQLDALSETVKQHGVVEREMQNDIDTLVAERDEVFKERETMEEDQEELLLQLALQKEQLDACSVEIEELQKDAAQKEFSAKHAEDRLREAEEYIRELSITNDELRQQPQENGVHESGKVASLEQTVDELTLVKEELQQQVDDLSSTNAYLDAQVKTTEGEKDELRDRLSAATRNAQTATGDATMKEEQYRSRISDLEERCTYLDEMCRAKDKELEQVRTLVNELSTSQADVPSLHQSIASLERTRADQDRALHDKEIALERLHLEVEGLRTAAADSDATGPANVVFDVDLLNRKLQYAERTVLQYEERMKDVEAELEETRRELQEKVQALSDKDVALLDLEMELDVKAQNAGNDEELLRQLQEVKACLEQRNRDILEMEGFQQAMDEQVEALQAELEAEREKAALMFANGPISTQPEAQAGDAQQLQDQLTELQQQLQAANDEHRESHQSLRGEIMTLNEEIATKQAQLAGLESQLKSLSVELSSSQEQLVSKETDVRRLSVELEETRLQQLQSTRNATSSVLDASSREEAESIDNMRLHIIELARALEQSETQRADAIERLMKEREANTESIRRLGESVKRFYSSTLSCGDA